MFRRLAITLLAIVGAAWLMLAPAVQAIAPPLGGLTQLPGGAACVSASALPPCTTGNGINGPADLAVASDGAHVVTVASEGAVVAMARAASGALSFRSCLSADGDATGPGGADLCSPLAALVQPTAVAASPDGRDVYVGSYSAPDATLVHLRLATTGALTFVDCLASTAVFGCTQASGLADIADIAISADGRVAATASDASQGGVAVFTRDPATGKLTFRDCIDSGSDPACDAGNSGYSGVAGVTLSPSGGLIYAAGVGGVTVTRYQTVFGIHDLAAFQCFSHDDPAPAGCSHLVAASGPQRIAMSPDTGGVYTASPNGALASYRRDPQTGALTYLGCRSYLGQIDDPGDCASDFRLQLVEDVAVSPDARTVYAVAGRSNPDQGAQDIAVYSRDPVSGAIKPLADPSSCWAEPAAGLSSCSPAVGMEDPVAVAVAPQGDSVYLASRLGTSTVAAFEAEVAPTCQAVNATVAAGGAGTLSLACGDLNGDPLTRSILTGPSHGSLGAVGADGTVKYSAAAGFTGVDSFTFGASDGVVASAPAVATITAVADAVAPVISRLSVSHRRFRVRQRARRHAQGRPASRRAPVGTRFRYSLSEAATVRITLERRTIGRRVGRSCKRQTRANRQRKRCVRYVRVTTMTQHGVAGRNSKTFSGRYGKRSKAFATGRYRGSLQATDAGGNRSKVRRAAFKVVRR